MCFFFSAPTSHTRGASKNAAAAKSKAKSKGGSSSEKAKGKGKAALSPMVDPPIEDDPVVTGRSITGLDFNALLGKGGLLLKNFVI